MTVTVTIDDDGDDEGYGRDVRTSSNNRSQTLKRRQRRRHQLQGILRFRDESVSTHGLDQKHQQRQLRRNLRRRGLNGSTKTKMMPCCHFVLIAAAAVILILLFSGIGNVVAQQQHRQEREELQQQNDDGRRETPTTMPQDTAEVEIVEDGNGHGEEQEEPYYDPRNRHQQQGTEEEDEEREPDSKDRQNPVHVVSTTAELHSIVKSNISSSSPSSSLPPPIFVLLAYKNDCEQSMQELWRFHFAVREILQTDHQTAENTTIMAVSPVFIQLVVNDDTIQLLERYGIKTVPTLFFIKGQQRQQQEGEEEGEPEQEQEQLDAETDIFATTSFYAVKYRGITSNVPHLVDGIYHYLARLQFSFIREKTNNVNNSNRKYLDALTVHAKSLQDLQEIILSSAYRGRDRSSGGDDEGGGGGPTKNHKSLLLRNSPPIPLEPHYSESEDEWIRYVMDDGNRNDHFHYNDGDDDNDTFHVICQCRCCDGRYDSNNEYSSLIGEDDTIDGNDDIDNGSESIDVHKSYRTSTSSLNLTVYNEFDLVANVLSARRDVLFCVLTENCSTNDDDDNDDHSPDADGSISSFTVGPDNGWKLEKNRVLQPSSDGKNFTDWVSPMLRPDIMWLDRRMTAPILFQQQYAVHTVLFVDFHDKSKVDIMRDAVRILRSECQDQRKRYGDESMVCLVVPSTDTRLLKTFGIDIWSPIDRYATRIISAVANGLYDSEESGGTEDKSDLNDKEMGLDDVLSPPPSVLPSILLTNRRKDRAGIERYYLDPPITREAVNQFMTDFRSGIAVPEIKSRRRRSTYSSGINKHGIYILTGETLPSFLEDHKHSDVLLQLYAPTCGHCKRFNVVWNGLGDLIEYLGWNKDDSVSTGNHNKNNNKLVLARMDVTSNDAFIPGMPSPIWLPDLFYFRKGVTERPIRYEQTQTGKKVPLGAFSDPLDLIEWWLDQAGESVDESLLLDNLLVGEE